MQQPEFFRDFARALASFKDPILRRLFYEYILHNPEVLGECVIPLYVTRAEDCIAVQEKIGKALEDFRVEVVDKEKSLIVSGKTLFEVDPEKCKQQV